MKLIVKVFPEITIKSPPVRKGFIRQLAKNIRTVLRELDPEVRVEGVWDNIEVETALSEPKPLREMIERLRCTPGIAHCLEVHEYPLGDLDDIVARCKAHYAERLPGRIFAVRCKRAGKHPFSSMDVERHVACRQPAASAVRCRRHLAEGTGDRGAHGNSRPAPVRRP